MTTVTTSTALDRVIAKGKIVLKQASWTLRDVAEAVVDPLSDTSATTEVVSFPALPKPVALTTEVRTALSLVPGIFGQVNLTERRSLTDDEIAQARIEQDTVRQVLEALSGRDEAIKEMIRVTMDVRAEESGRAVPKAVKAGNGAVIVPATLRDKAGHYILASKGNPERLPIPATNMEYSQEFRAGSLTISAADLDRMHTEGEVSREDYLALTVEKRVFDEKKAEKAITDKPERMAIIRAISSRSGATTSLFVRKAK